MKMSWPDVAGHGLLVLNTLIAGFAAMQAAKAKRVALQVRRQTRRENLIRSLRISRYMDKEATIRKKKK